MVAMGTMGSGPRLCCVPERFGSVYTAPLSPIIEPIGQKILHLGAMCVKSVVSCGSVSKAYILTMVMLVCRGPLWWPKTSLDNFYTGS